MKSRPALVASNWAASLRQLARCFSPKVSRVGAFCELALHQPAERDDDRLARRDREPATPHALLQRVDRQRRRRGGEQLQHLVLISHAPSSGLR
jgi:hypothetical protein